MASGQDRLRDKRPGSAQRLLSSSKGQFVLAHEDIIGLCKLIITNSFLVILFTKCYEINLSLKLALDKK